MSWRMSAQPPDTLGYKLLRLRIQHRMPVVDEVFELVPVACEESLHRPCGRFAEGGPFEIVAGAQHGFAVDDLPVYEREAAERHWRELEKLFSAALHSGVPAPGE